MFPNSRLVRVLFLFLTLLAIIAMELLATPPTPPPQRAYTVRLERNVYLEDSPNLELRCSFGPTHRSEGKKISAVIIANNGLRILGDSIWQVDLQPSRSYEELLKIRINPHDTSSFDITLEGGAWPETYSYYFVYEPGNIKCFQGHPSKGKEIASTLMPFVFKASLEQKDPNEFWFKTLGKNGKYAGYFHTAKSKSDTDLSDIYILHEGFSTVDNGRTIRYDVYCEDNTYFTLRRLAIEMIIGDVLSFDTVYFSKGTWSPSHARKSQIKTRTNDLFEPVLCHVIRRLPFEKGVDLKYLIPQWQGGVYKPEREVKYLGQESVRVVDSVNTMVTLHKFVAGRLYYYLDNDHNIILLHNGNKNSFRMTESSIGSDLLEVNWDSLETTFLNK